MRRLAGTLGFAAVLLAACGGGNSPGAAKARYIADADPVCRQALTSAASIGSATDTPTLEKARDLWNDTFQKIDALPVPQEGEAKVLEFKAGLRNIRLTAEDVVQASMVGNQQRMQDSLRVQAEAKRRTGKAADEYGFKVCNQL